MSSGFEKELFFGGALGDEDIGNLNLSKLFEMGELLEDNKETQLERERKQIEQEKFFKNPHCDDNLLPVNENDLNLEVICIQEGEKIYRLSDLIIPINKKKIRVIESYMHKLLTQPEKDKNEKEEDVKKKMIHEKKEIATLIKKSKRNQKYSKINILHNEKFFDKTVFIDSSSANVNKAKEGMGGGKGNDDDDDNVSNYNNNKLCEGEKESNNENKRNLTVINGNVKVDYGNNISNELFMFKQKLNSNKCNNINEDNNYNNNNGSSSAEYAQLNQQQQQSYENEILSNFTSLINNKINNTNNNNNNNNKHNTHTALSNTQHINSNNSSNDISYKHYKHQSPLQTKHLFSPISNLKHNPTNINTNTIINDISHSSPLPSYKHISTNNSDLIENANNSSLFLLNKDFLNYSYQNSSFIKQISYNDNISIKPYLHSPTIPSEFSFKPTQTQYDKYDLYDFIKKKRNRSEGYYNPALNQGIFINAYLLTPYTSSSSYSNISKLIYDLNDYNMNFEILHHNDNNNTTNTTTNNNATTVNGNSNINNTNNNVNKDNNTSVNDDFFASLVTSKIKLPPNPSLKIGNSKGNLVTHAKCSYNFTYNKINLRYDDLADFHRPNFCKWTAGERQKRSCSIVIGETCDINNDNKNKHYPCKIITKSTLFKKEKKLMNKNVQYMNAYEIFKDRKKLSLIDGKFCLFEHIDEYPLFISNFGMASKMKKYLYSNKLFTSNATNPNSKLSESEIKTYNMIGPNGTQILLTQNQKLPLLGQIDVNEIKGLNILDNNMYRAPIFYERINGVNSSNNFNACSNNGSSNNNNSSNSSSKAPRYNFLLTLKKGKDGKQVFYIRELEHLYTVAQEEPKIEVYPPQSRQYNTFLKNKIETYTYKLYNEIGYKAGINFKEFTNLFPMVTEQVLKKNFKEMNIEIDKNICYFTKIPNELNQSRITPENICQFESCQFGIYQLREVGIKNLTNADKISYATNKFITQTPDIKQQYLARVTEEQLLTTPWNITQNYLQSKQIKGMLSIKGIGDPSNGNGGYSFLKMPVKSYNENKTLKEEMDVLKSQNKNIKTVTGTDADLRKLSKEEIKINLIQLGVEEEYIKNLSRWERVDLLRYHSSKAYELGYEGEITKYARNQRFNTKTQREEYQRNINEVFKKQINYIINNDIPLNEDSSDDEYEAKVNQYADQSQLTNANEYYFTEESEKKKKSMAFMRNIIFPNKKKKPICGNSNNNNTNGNNSVNLNDSFAMPDKSVTSKRSTHRNNNNSNNITININNNNNHITLNSNLNTISITNINQSNDDKIIKIYNKSSQLSNMNSNNNHHYHSDQNSKIRLDVNNVDIDFLTHKTKHRHFDSIYEYEFDKNPGIKRVNRRETPEKIYNELIGDIIDFCIRNDYTKLFLQPVKKKDYPNYHIIVTHPMDLSTMKNKTKRSEYKNTNEVLSDFDLMINNSELFNGKEHPVTEQARKLKEYGVKKIDENSTRIVELESKIKTDLSRAIIK
jgi:hypothetical protein